jgi:hypothetical protein
MVVLALCASPLSSEKRVTKIQLTVGVSQVDVQRLLSRYCQDFRVVPDVKDADYVLYIVKTDKDPELPYTFTVIDPEDSSVIAVDTRSSVAGAVKDSCSAMHIRFGEDK